MTDQLFDRYKDALRAGHVAVLRGRLDEALAAYRDAERIAPDRPLPHTSLGGVLLDLGRVDEALEELRLALELSPRDEGALLGRAEALGRAGRRSEAASTLDTLAEVQEAAGRHADVVDTLQRALVLEERVGRRRRYQAAVRDLRVASGGRLSEGASSLARPLAEPAPIAEPDAVPGPEAGDGALGLDAGPAANAPSAQESGPADAGAPSEETAEPSGPVAPAEPAEPPDPRSTGERLVATAEEAAARGDGATALEAYREAARVFDEAGLPIAALDACREALALAPGDVDVHLRYAAIYRSKGWREIAANRIASILRLVDLEGDVEGRARICAVIAETYPDDERLSALCA